TTRTWGASNQTVGRPTGLSSKVKRAAANRPPDSLTTTTGHRQHVSKGTCGANFSDSHARWFSFRRWPAAAAAPARAEAREAAAEGPTARVEAPRAASTAAAAAEAREA